MLTLTAPANPLARPLVHTFKRRESLPLEANRLWQIQSGAVRLLTLSEDGTPITLGFWESGDLTGQPLICIQPSEIECLTRVQAVLLSPDQCWNFQQVMRSHLHQMQELIRFRQGQVPQRLQQLLGWLALKFGRPIEQGRLIQLRLTHQDMADAIGRAVGIGNTFTSTACGLRSAKPSTNCTARAAKRLKSRSPSAIDRFWKGTQAIHYP